MSKCSVQEKKECVSIRARRSVKSAFFPLGMKTLFHKGGNRGWKSGQRPGKLDQQHGVYNKTQHSTTSVIQLPCTTLVKECCEYKRKILSNPWRRWLRCRKASQAEAEGLRKPCWPMRPSGSEWPCEHEGDLVFSNPCLARQLFQLLMTSTPDTWTNLRNWTCEHTFASLEVCNLQIPMEAACCTDHCRPGMAQSTFYALTDASRHQS